MDVNITLLILLSSRTPLHGKLNYRKFIYVFFLKKKAVVHTAIVFQKIVKLFHTEKIYSEFIWK